MDSDNIQFYDDATIQKWFDEYVKSNRDHISEIPFGYYDIVAELSRRDNIKDEVSTA
jgi:hypothetical protein